MDKRDLVVSILLQHPAITEDCHIYCSLLRTSKVIRNAVIAQCKGSLAAQHTAATKDQLGAFAAWLMRHCALLKRLSLQLPHAAEDYHNAVYPERTELANTVAMAMAPSTESQSNYAASAEYSSSGAATSAAAAAPVQAEEPSNVTSTAAGAAWTVSFPGSSQEHGQPQPQQQQRQQQCSKQEQLQHRQHHNMLPLQSLVISYASSMLLRQLPAACLTSLDFSIPSTESPVKIAAAVAQLTGLCSLSMGLHRDRTAPNALRKWRARSNTLAAAINGGFTRLKTLKLRNWADLKGLCGLPSSVQELHLHYGDSISQSLTAAHGLSRLTALTELCFSGLCFGPVGDTSGSSGGASVCKQQLLPLSLRRLSLPDCAPSVQPLLGLQHLEHLAMTYSTVPGQQLLQLGKALPRLSELRLEYGSDDMATCAAPGWAALPVKDLLFDETVSAAVVTSIGQQSGLTALRVYDVDATPQQVAAALKQLTSLQELFLHVFDMSSRAALSEPAVGAQSMAALLEVIASLPVLSSLVLGARLGPSHYQEWEEGLGTQLRKATQLRVLHLAYCGVTDSTVAVLAQHLHGLQELALNSNRQITDLVIPDIAANLVRLTELDVRDTGVTEAGLQQLPSMKARRGHCLLVTSSSYPQLL